MKSRPLTKHTFYRIVLSAMRLCYRFVGDTLSLCAFLLELVLQIALYKKR
jgi:hypothetical protein